MDNAATPSLMRLNQLPDLALDIRRARARPRDRLARCSIRSRFSLARELAAEVLEQVAAHQLVAQCHENAFLHFLAADGQAIRAGAA